MNETGSTYWRTQNETSSGQGFNDLLTYTDVIIEGEGGVTQWNSSNAQSSQMPAMQHVVLSVYLVTFAFGTLGNTLTIYGLVRTKHLKSVANCFILNLAIADDLFLLCLPFTAHSSYVNSWVFGDALCKVLNVFRGANLYASIFTMTLMSIDRYLAVAHPFDSLRYRTHRNALVVCTLTWVVCLTIMTPYWMYSRTHLTSEDVVKCQINWPKETLSEHLWMWANFELVVGFILPIVVMAVCYALLLRCLVTDSRSAQVRRQGKTHVWRVTSMIFLVTVVFLVCWAPHHALKMFSSHQHPVFREQRGVPESTVFGYQVAYTVTQGLIYVSSCCNPFIYYITSTNFRQIYKTALCGCGGDNTAFSRNSTFKSSGFYLSKKNSARGSVRGSKHNNSASGSVRNSGRNANSRQSLRTPPVQGSTKRPTFEVTDLQPQRTSRL